MIHATSELGPSSAASPLVKLCIVCCEVRCEDFHVRTCSTSGAFGASLDEGTYIRVSYSGRLTVEDMRDCLRVIRNLVCSRSKPTASARHGIGWCFADGRAGCAQSSTRRQE